MSPERDRITVNLVNPIALRKAKIVHNFGLSVCNRVKVYDYTSILFCQYYKRGITFVL